MVRNRPRRPKRDIRKELVRRERGRLLGRVGFFRSLAAARLRMLVPTRFRWLLPFLQEAALDGFQREEVAAEAVVEVAIVPEVRPEVRDTLAIPALEDRSEIVGLRSRYHLEYLDKIRGKGRLYRGTDVASERPVAVREYLLPPQRFSPKEIRERQELFMLRGGLRLADGCPHNEPPEPRPEH